MKTRSGSDAIVYLRVKKISALELAVTSFGVLPAFSGRKLLYPFTELILEAVKRLDKR